MGATLHGRFQCLFGWDATVEEACKQNDTKRLAKLLPGADAVEPAMLPAVAQMASGSLPMIEDCRHWTWATTDGSGGEAKTRFRQSTLFQEFPFQVIQGPCANGRHNGPYTKCTMCKKVLCVKCTRETGIVRSPNGKHILEEVEDALAEVQAAASKAKEAEHFGPQTVTTVWQHPQRPLPFYVLDGQKLADTEKLAWIHQELEEGAGIETFCTTFLDIFADTVSYTHLTLPTKRIV